MMHTLEISDDILSTARMSLDDVRVELAVALYAARRLPVGKARELARMSLWEFRQLLASRRIPVDLDENDLDEEVAALHRLGSL